MITNKKYLHISYIALITLLLAGLFFFNIKKDRTTVGPPVPPQAAAETKIEAPKNYSLATFFHRSAYVCSVAVPEEWEGKYRQSDGGSTVYFYYIGNNGAGELLFYITYIDLKTYDLEKKNLSPESFELLRNSKYVYISDDKSDAKNNDPEYAKMKNEMMAIRSSLKCTPAK